MPRRRVCVVTGTRAEYGLLYWLLRYLAQDDEVNLQIVATAMHLEPAFGHTIDQIRKDGFTVNAEVPMDLTSDQPSDIARSTGRGLIGLADAFEKLKPDIIALLGDRFETLAAATAATLMRIPIGHIHGGEISEGAIDDAMRHAITKLSHLHFVAANPFKERLIQMGEDPSRIFALGAPGLDHLTLGKLPDRAAIAERVGLSLDRPLFLVTYHPATLADTDPVAEVDELLAALDSFPDAAILLTKANADAGGRAINARLEKYAEANKGRAVLVASLGSEYYLGALKEAAVVIGNSSSGIIEAPAAGTPTVNIGVRQNGRLRSASVFDCSEDRQQIEAAIRRALEPGVSELLARQNPAYGRPGNCSRWIMQQLRSFPLEGILVKRFHDIGAVP